MVWLLLACAGTRSPTFLEASGSAPGSWIDDSFPSWEDDSRAENPEVIIVGGGLAGLVVAGEHGSGTVLEAGERPGGRILWTDAPFFFLAGTPEQDDEGLDITVENTLEQWEDLTGGPATEATEAWLWSTIEVRDYIVDLGLELQAIDESVDGISTRAHGLQSSGFALIEAITDTLSDRVEVRTETRVDEVVVEDGVAVGVLVDGELIEADAVVVAAGGYVGNSDLLALGTGWEDDGTWAASPEDGGVGQSYEWALESGWGVAHTDIVGWHSRYMAVPTSDGLVLADSAPPQGWVWVDASGERFVDESATGTVGLSGHLREHEPAWGILSPDSLDICVHEEHEEALEDALADEDRVVCRATVAELALATGIDEDGLDGTVEQVDAIIAGTLSDPHGRCDENFMALLDGGICAFKPGLMASKNFGGIDVDMQGRVRDADGELITGLYAAGEAAGMAVPGMGGEYGFDGSISAIIWSGWQVAGAIDEDFSR